MAINIPQRLVLDGPYAVGVPLSLSNVTIVLEVSSTMPMIPRSLIDKMIARGATIATNLHSIPLTRDIWFICTPSFNATAPPTKYRNLPARPTVIRTIPLANICDAVNMADLQTLILAQVGRPSPRFHPAPDAAMTLIRGYTGGESERMRNIRNQFVARSAYVAGHIWAHDLASWPADLTRFPVKNVVVTVKGEDDDMTGSSITSNHSIALITSSGPSDTLPTSSLNTHPSTTLPGLTGRQRALEYINTHPSRVANLAATAVKSIGIPIRGAAGRAASAIAPPLGSAGDGHNQAYNASTAPRSLLVLPPVVQRPIMVGFPPLLIPQDRLHDWWDIKPIPQFPSAPIYPMPPRSLLVLPPPAARPIMVGLAYTMIPHDRLFDPISKFRPSLLILPPVVQTPITTGFAYLMIPNDRLHDRWHIHPIPQWVGPPPINIAPPPPPPAPIVPSLPAPPAPPTGVFLNLKKRDIDGIKASLPAETDEEEEDAVNGLLGVGSAGPSSFQPPARPVGGTGIRTRMRPAGASGAAKRRAWVGT